MGVPAGATQNQIMNQQITMKTHTQGGGLSDDPVQHPFYRWEKKVAPRGMAEVGKPAQGKGRDE